MAVSPEQAAQTMIDNLPAKTGKSLDEWQTVIKAWLQAAYQAA